jgi:predicted DNA-binding transcriptional regulator AlpA
MGRVRSNGATVWLTATELADRLKVAQSTLWQWNLRNYGPPAVRIGGKLRYRVEAVEAWEAEQEREAAARAR